MRESGQIWGHETFTHVSEQQERGTETQPGRGEQRDRGDGDTAIRERRTGTQGSGRGGEVHRDEGKEDKKTGIREMMTGRQRSGRGEHRIGEK